MVGCTRLLQGLTDQDVRKRIESEDQIEQDSPFDSLDGTEEESFVDADGTLMNMVIILTCGIIGNGFR